MSVKGYTSVWEIMKQTADKEELKEYSENPEVSYTNWSTIYNGGGEENRTKTTKTKNFKKIVTKSCEFKRNIFLNGFLQTYWL